MKWKSLSRVQLFATLWTVACQAPLSMGFPRQEHWSGLPCPSLGYLADPGIEHTSPAWQADSLLSEPLIINPQSKSTSVRNPSSSFLARNGRDVLDQLENQYNSPMRWRPSGNPISFLRYNKSFCPDAYFSELPPLPLSFLLILSPLFNTPLPPNLSHWTHPFSIFITPLSQKCLAITVFV